jgi:hypothetical protein
MGGFTFLQGEETLVHINGDHHLSGIRGTKWNVTNILLKVKTSLGRLFKTTLFMLISHVVFVSKWHRLFRCEAVGQQIWMAHEYFFSCGAVAVVRTTSSLHAFRLPPSLYTATRISMKETSKSATAY